MKRLTILVFFSIQLASLPAATYEELIARAISADPGIAQFSIEERQAEIAYERALIARNAPTIELGTGSVSATLSDDSYWSASPTASLTMPDGMALGAQLPTVRYSSGYYAKPKLSLGLPIVRGSDDMLVAVEAARLDREKAESARAQAELSLEGKMAAAFKAELSSEVTLQSSLAAEAKAKREFDQAVAVDGAEPGGTAYMGLQRDLRTATRARRDAEAKKARSLYDLRVLLGPGSEAELMPVSYPAVDMSRALPAPELCLSAARSRAESGLAGLRSAEAERRSTLGAKLGVGYGLGSDAIGTYSELGTSGPDFSGGLEAVLGPSGLKLSGGIDWSPGSPPSANLSLAWSPKPRKDEKLRSEDLALSARSRALGLAEALVDAGKSLAALENSRRDLVQAADDAEEDLSFAQAQLAAYAASRDLGVTSESEYAEVLADRELCAARLRVAELDRITWDIEARALIAGSSAYGEVR